MKTIRVQFIGVEKLPVNTRNEHFRKRELLNLPSEIRTKENLSYHDYHVVVIQSPPEVPYNLDVFYEFYDYLQNNGIIIFFVSSYDWFPWENDKFIKHQYSSGDAIECNSE